MSGEITYTGSLGRGWRRMRRILFSPFDVSKWFVLGFTAWLAYLADWKGPGGNGGSKARGRFDSWDEFGSCVGRWTDNWFGGGVALLVVLCVIFAAILLFILFLWLSSRGHFLFLDNLVHDRARVKDPWSRFGRLGDSLFAWRLVYTLVCLLAIGPLVALVALSAAPFAVESLPIEVGVIGLVVSGLTAGLFLLAAVYVDFFLLHFVVPLMYRHEITTMEGWRRLMPLLKERFFDFFLYSLFYLLLNVALFGLIMIFGAMTCCIGFLLLAIPYLGAVILLPATVVLRGMDLEFLAQFGDECDLTALFPARAMENAAGEVPPDGSV